MTEKREFYAASVEEAVAKAATRLGIGQDELSYRVVDQGNSGFLGIGARDARIEVDAPPAARDEESSPSGAPSTEEVAVEAATVEEDAQRSGA